MQEVNPMSHVNPAIRPQFESTMSDLMACLEQIIAEGERHA